MCSFSFECCQKKAKPMEIWHFLQEVLTFVFVKNVQIKSFNFFFFFLRKSYELHIDHELHMCYSKYKYIIQILNTKLLFMSPSSFLQNCLGTWLTTCT